MFKRIFTITVAIAFVSVMFFTANADAALRHFKITVYKTATERGLYDINYATKFADNVAYSVHQYNGGTTKPITRETTYKDTARTELLSNPWVTEALFDDTGDIDFYCDPTYSDDKTVYLVVVDLLGGYSWSGPVAYDKDHTIIIDERPGMVHTLMFPALMTGRASVLTATNTATYTGIYLPPASRVVDAWVEIHSPCAKFGLKGIGASSLDVYITGGTPIAIISSLDMSTAGVSQDAYRYTRNTELPAVSADSSKQLVIKVTGATGSGGAPGLSTSTIDGFIMLDLITR